MTTAHDRPAAPAGGTAPTWPAGPATTTVEQVCDAAAAHRDHGERHGTLDPRVWRTLAASPLPRVALPADCGGLQWTVPDIVDAVRRVGVADPAAGWVAAINAPAGAFLARLDPAVARDVAGAGTIVAGSSVPVGHAEPHDGGIHLRGRWPLVTGAPGMTLAALAAPAPGPNGTPVTRWWLVPRRVLTIEEDWDAFGLRGTASHTVRCATDVPWEHSVVLADPAVVDVPLYRYPLYGLLAGCIAAVAAATAQRALDAFAGMAARTGSRYSSGALAQQPAVQAAWSRADGRVRAATALLDGATAAAWACALDGEVPAEPRALLRSACCQMADAAEAACRELFDAAGSAAVHNGNGLAGCVRDATVIARHALVATRGRQLVGAHGLAASTAREL